MIKNILETLEYRTKWHEHRMSESSSQYVYFGTAGHKRSYVTQTYTTLYCLYRREHEQHTRQTSLNNLPVPRQTQTQSTSTVRYTRQQRCTFVNMHSCHVRFEYRYFKHYTLIRCKLRTYSCVCTMSIQLPM